MTRRFVIPGVLVLLLTAPALRQSIAADTELRSDCIAHFATDAEAAEVLGQKDDFVQRLSPFDRAARLKTDQPVAEDRFLAFVKSSVSPWTATEETKIQTVIQAIRPALQKLSIAFPKRVLFIQTTGAEEGHAFYTRDTAVIMPRSEVEKATADELKKTIAHELFHILSRTNPELRDKLYEAIGFSHCDEVQLPPELAARKITNPDAPRNDHAIHLRFGGKDVRAVPILLATADKYDPTRGGEFFNYLQLKFLVIGQPGTAQLIDPAYASGFFEQVGHNTEYIIHPEEILADNFALLLVGGTARSPEVQEKIRRLFEQK